MLCLSLPLLISFWRIGESLLSQISLSLSSSFHSSRHKEALPRTYVESFSCEGQSHHPPTAETHRGVSGEVPLPPPPPPPPHPASDRACLKWASVGEGEKEELNRCCFKGKKGEGTVSHSRKKPILVEKGWVFFEHVQNRFLPSSRFVPLFLFLTSRFSPRFCA